MFIVAPNFMEDQIRSNSFFHFAQVVPTAVNTDGVYQVGAFGGQKAMLFGPGAVNNGYKIGGSSLTIDGTYGIGFTLLTSANYRVAALDVYRGFINVAPVTLGSDVNVLILSEVPI